MDVLFCFVTANTSFLRMVSHTMEQKAIGEEHEISS